METVLIVVMVVMAFDGDGGFCVNGADCGAVGCDYDKGRDGDDGGDTCVYKGKVRSMLRGLELRWDKLS